MYRADTNEAARKKAYRDVLETIRTFRRLSKQRHISSSNTYPVMPQLMYMSRRLDDG